MRALKNRVRARLSRWRIRFVRAFRSYGPSELVAALSRAGVTPGDTIMVHSAFDLQHGFRGTISNVIDALLEAVGPEGNVLMVSMPYRSSSLEYLRKERCFEVLRTPSAMGLVSEFFRRRPGVVRSLHPTHPVLAYGPRAAWFVEGHEDCLYGCGPGSPFEKLAQVGGKLVFFNVDLKTMTFFHYLEHLLSPRFPFKLYTDEPLDVPVVDHAGQRRTLRAYVYPADAVRRRRPARLHGWLRERGLVHEQRVGASRLQVVGARETVALVEEMAGRGEYFHDMTEAG